MKMTKVLAVPCLLALIPASGSAQIARVSLTAAPLSIVSGSVASAPGLESAPGAAVWAAPILPLAPPALAVVNAAPAPAPVAVAKPVLAGLESGALRFAQAARDGASASEGLAISASMFDAAAKSGDAAAPPVDARVAGSGASSPAKGGQKSLMDELKEVPGVEYAQLGGYRSLIVAIDGSKPLAAVEAGVKAKFPDLAKTFDTLLYVDAKNPMKTLAKVDLKGAK